MLQWFKRKTNQPVSTPDSAALTREVAGIASDLWAQTDAFMGVRPNRDPLLGSRQPDAAYAYPFGLFEEALDKDAHLSALIAQRKSAVLSWERQVVPADSSPEARLVADVVELALGNIGSGGILPPSAGRLEAAPTITPGTGGPRAAVLNRRLEAAPTGSPAGTPALPTAALQDGGFERDLSELLDAIPYGLAVSEVIWSECQGGRMKDEGGRLNTEGGRLKAEGGSEDPDSSFILSPSSFSSPWLLPTALRSRHPRRFVFDTQGGLRLLTPSEPFMGEALAAHKFLVFAPYGRHEDPYGLPMLRSVWWLAYFKRQVLRFWVMFAEKFGTPTTVLKHPLGATEREKAAYRRIIGSIQQETGLVVPEGVELALLEAQRGGTVQTYSDLLHFCNEEMSKALVGQTLTSEATDRGARSLGEVHLAVRQDIVRQDAQALEALVNGQLVRWIVDLNFPPALRRYPRWRLSPPKQDDLALQLSIDSFFLGQGLALDETELYARYGRTRVAAASAPLAFECQGPRAKSQG
jgi:hypothetical protein